MRRKAPLKLEVELSPQTRDADAFEAIKSNLIAVLNNFGQLHARWARMSIEENLLRYQVASQRLLNSQIPQSGLSKFHNQEQPKELLPGLVRLKAGPEYFFRNIIWNTFLRNYPPHASYTQQLVTSLSEHLEYLGTRDGDCYHKENIFTLVNMQVPLDNTKFQRVAPHLRLRVVCMVFFKYVNTTRLAQVFENFLDEIDLKNKAHTKALIYKYSEKQCAT